MCGAILGCCGRCRAAACGRQTCVIPAGIYSSLVQRAPLARIIVVFGLWYLFCTPGHARRSAADWCLETLFRELPEQAQQVRKGFYKSKSWYVHSLLLTQISIKYVLRRVTLHTDHWWTLSHLDTLEFHLELLFRYFNHNREWLIAQGGSYISHH